MDATLVGDQQPKKTVGLGMAILVIFIFISGCVFAGYAIGYKFFWQKFDKTIRVDREIFAYSAKVKQNPEDLDSLNKLAWLSYQKKEYELAIQSCKRVLELNKQEPNAHYVLGLVYFDQNHYDLAEQEFGIINQNYPKNTLAILALAKTYLAEDHAVKSIPLLENLVRLDKGLADGYLYLGEAYLKDGHASKALEQFNQVLRLSPENQKAKDWITSLNSAQSKP